MGFSSRDPALRLNPLRSNPPKRVQPFYTALHTKQKLLLTLCSLKGGETVSHKFSKAFLNDAKIMLLLRQ